MTATLIPDKDIDQIGQLTGGLPALLKALRDNVLTLTRGEAALDGGNPTPVATGLNTVVAFLVQLKGTAAPGVGTSVLTTDISGTTGNVYAWKVTSAANPTLIASTGTESFYWVA